MIWRPPPTRWRNEHEHIREWLETRFDDYVGVGGCRDISAVIADDVASLHAARFSRVLRTEALGQPAGAIWIHGVSGALSRVPVGASEVIKSGDWSVRIGASVREIVFRMLEEHKPKEVAGYLHGIRDAYRKEILVCHASIEPPLVQSETKVKIDTSKYENPFAGTLEYLGSWHTHPEGRTGTSGKDEQTASRLTSLGGLRHPLLFLIVGPGELAIHLRG